MSKKILICLLALICFFTINVKADDTDTDLELVEVVEEIIEDEVDDDEDEALSNDLEQENEEESVILDDSINDDSDSSALDDANSNDSDSSLLDTGESEEEPVIDGNDLEDVVEETHSYNVTFVNGDYRLNIVGGSDILLSELLVNQGINISLSDISNVRLSNYEVLRVDKLDNDDYKIVSLNPFNTTEELFIVLKVT